MDKNEVLTYTKDSVDLYPAQISISKSKLQIHPKEHAHCFVNKYKFFASICGSASSRKYMTVRKLRSVVLQALKIEWFCLCLITLFKCFK